MGSTHELSRQMMLLVNVIALVVVLLVVSRNTRDTDIERRNRLPLLDIPAEERDATEARKTLRRAKVAVHTRGSADQSRTSR